MGTRNFNKMDELAKRTTMSMNADMILGTRGASSKQETAKYDAQSSSKEAAASVTESQGQQSKPSSGEKIQEAGSRQSRLDTPKGRMEHKTHWSNPAQAAEKKPDKRESQPKATGIASADTKARTASSFSQAIRSTNKQDNCLFKRAPIRQQESTQQGTIDAEAFSDGDKVVIRVDEENLMKMQKDYGGTTKLMLQVRAME